MEQNSQNSVKVTYEIVDPKVNETTSKIVNAYNALLLAEIMSKK